MRWAAFLCLAMASCAHHEVAPTDNTPLNQRLTTIAAMHNSGDAAAFKSYFAKGATIQLPATPRFANVDHYLQALAADPYTIAFSNTEIVYSLPGRSATRSVMTANSPGRINLQEQVTVDWVMEDGYWKISRIAVSDWPTIIGTWRRNGLKGEGTIELRILPGNTYLVYIGEDYTLPAFRGHYTLEGNKIIFADLSANEAKNYQAGSGSYIFTRTSTGMNFRRVEEGNTWRSERYDGDWILAR